MKYVCHLKKGLICAVKSILEDIEKNGLPQDKSLILTLNNKSKDSIVSEKLKLLYPAEMRISISKEDYENLCVYPNHFEVTLLMDTFSEILKIPYTTILKVEDHNCDFFINLDIDPENKFVVENNVININFENH